MITISTPHTFKTLNNKILSIYKFHLKVEIHNQ